MGRARPKEPARRGRHWPLRAIAWLLVALHGAMGQAPGLSSQEQQVQQQQYQLTQLQACATPDTCGGTLEGATSDAGSPVLPLAALGSPCLTTATSLDNATVAALRRSGNSTVDRLLDQQGWVLGRYSNATAGGRTATRPAVPAPGGGAGGGAAAALQLLVPGAAALLFSTPVQQPDQVLSFQWYLCPGGAGAFTATDETVSLAGALQLSTNLQGDCQVTCGKWCDEAACAGGCCPAAGRSGGNATVGVRGGGGAACALCPSYCSTLCGSCLDQCYSLQAPVQTARVDLFVQPARRQAAWLAARGALLRPPSEELPVDRACAPEAGCNRTLLSPADLGSADVQCGWQVFTLPLGDFVGSVVTVVARAVDVRMPGTGPLAFALDNLIVGCAPAASTLPPAPPGTLLLPSSPPPPPTPAAPPPQAPSPPPLVPQPPSPPLGCYAGPCAAALGAAINLARGSLGDCVTTALASPGCSGFVPFRLSVNLTDAYGAILPPPAYGPGGGAGAGNADPGADSAAQGDASPEREAEEGGQAPLPYADVASLQLEQMGVAALVYRKFVASPDEVLTVTWQLCAPGYTGDDTFSVPSLQATVGAATAACSTACSSNCTACSVNCCTPPPCNQECMRSCCFSCWATCNGLEVPVQAARLDVYNASQPLSQGDLEQLLFSDQTPSCQSALGCTPLLDTLGMGSNVSMCLWRTQSWSMAAYVGQHVAVAMRAVDSRSPGRVPLQLAVSSITCSCPYPPPPPPRPPPPSPPAPSPPPAPPSPPYGNCLPTLCDGTFESGALGQCVSTFRSPANHSGGFKVEPYLLNSSSDYTAPILPPPPRGLGGQFMVQLVQDVPGAATLTYTKFVSSPRERLRFRWYVCTRANFSAGPFSYGLALAQQEAAQEACQGRCGEFCGDDVCATLCCKGGACNPTCQVECISQCVNCQQQCSNNGSAPTQAFRADLFRVPWDVPELTAAMLDEASGGGGLEGAAGAAAAVAAPCRNETWCLRPLVDFARANASMCKWQAEDVDMAPYVGLTVAVVVRVIDMRNPRALQLAAAVDDFWMGCPAPGPPPEPPSPPDPPSPPLRGRVSRFARDGGGGSARRGLGHALRRALGGVLRENAAAGGSSARGAGAALARGARSAWAWWRALAAAPERPSGHQQHHGGRHHRRQQRAVMEAEEEEPRTAAAGEGGASSGTAPSYEQLSSSSSSSSSSQPDASAAFPRVGARPELLPPSRSPHHPDEDEEEEDGGDDADGGSGPEGGRRHHSRRRRRRPEQHAAATHVVAGGGDAGGPGRQRTSEALVRARVLASAADLLLLPLASAAEQAEARQSGAALVEGGAGGRAAVEQGDEQQQEEEGGVEWHVMWHPRRLSAPGKEAAGGAGAALPQQQGAEEELRSGPGEVGADATAAGAAAGGRAQRWLQPDSRQRQGGGNGGGVAAEHGGELWPVAEVEEGLVDGGGGSGGQQGGGGSSAADGRLVLPGRGAGGALANAQQQPQQRHESVAAAAAADGGRLAEPAGVIAAATTGSEQGSGVAGGTGDSGGGPGRAFGGPPGEAAVLEVASGTGQRRRSSSGGRSDHDR